jgi:hypothetical protein
VLLNLRFWLLGAPGEERFELDQRSPEMALGLSSLAASLHPLYDVGQNLI